MCEEEPINGTELPFNEGGERGEPLANAKASSYAVAEQGAAPEAPL
jgi:hypothetical protein